MTCDKKVDWQPHLQLQDCELSLYSGDWLEVRDASGISCQFSAEDTAKILTWLDERPVDIREHDDFVYSIKQYAIERGPIGLPLPTYTEDEARAFCDRHQVGLLFQDAKGQVHIARYAAGCNTLIVKWRDFPPFLTEKAICTEGSTSNV